MRALNGTHDRQCSEIGSGHHGGHICSARTPSNSPPGQRVEGAQKGWQDAKGRQRPVLHETTGIVLLHACKSSRAQVRDLALKRRQHDGGCLIQGCTKGSKAPGIIAMALPPQGRGTEAGVRPPAAFFQKCAKTTRAAAEVCWLLQYGRGTANASAVLVGRNYSPDAQHGSHALLPHFAVGSRDNEALGIADDDCDAKARCAADGETTLRPFGCVHVGTTIKNRPGQKAKLAHGCVL